MYPSVTDFIQANWDVCIHSSTADSGTLIGLPHPYTVPAVGHFDEMFYWDTYFTNLGLFLSGRGQQAKNNVDNMLYLVERYGFMPNGNRTYFLTRSQPPFLSIMVRDVYERGKDLGWLENAYRILCIEYQFWGSRRTFPIGLAHYDDESAPAQLPEIAAEFIRRIGMDPALPVDQLARHFYATAESGWDINPRWEYDCYNYAPVELNALLFGMEENMAFFSDELGNGQASLWRSRAAMRRKAMVQYMERPNGLLMDYNYVTGEQSSIFSAAAFYPLFVGMASPGQAAAVVRDLPRLEADHGIVTCEANDTPGSFQWDYPNGWACLQYIAMMGLDRYGYVQEARRIGQKYLNLVDRVYRDTGNLWEKYNVVEGNIRVTNEYGLPPMMGWSAGVYLATKDFLDRNP